MEPVNVDPFIQQFRDAMKVSYDTTLNQLAQERENAQQNIMSEANRAGMLYSNFPERAKMQYDTQTYDPNLLKVRSAYQTGLDSLRSKGVSLANSIRQMQEGISDYEYQTALANKYKSSISGTGEDAVNGIAKQALNSL